MEAKLTGLSPVSFMMARAGDILEIKHVSPRPGEIRATTGPMRGALLVYKDKTKIGKIPNKILEKLGESGIRSRCRVIKLDKDTGTIIVEIKSS